MNTTMILLDCPTVRVLYIPHEARVDISVKDSSGEWIDAALSAAEFHRFARRVADVTGAWKMAKSTIRDLSTRIRNLKREVTYAKARNEERNRLLDALGMVWCNGGCPGGMKRYGDLGFGPSGEVTAEHVGALLLNAGRALTWFINRDYRRARFDGSSVSASKARVAETLPVAYRWLVYGATDPWHGGADCRDIGEDAIS